MNYNPKQEGDPQEASERQERDKIQPVSGCQNHGGSNGILKSILEKRETVKSWCRQLGWAGFSSVVVIIFSGISASPVILNWFQGIEKDLKSMGYRRLNKDGYIEAIENKDEEAIKLFLKLKKNNPNQFVIKDDLLKNLFLSKNHLEITKKFRKEMLIPTEVCRCMGREQVKNHMLLIRGEKNPNVETLGLISYYAASRGADELTGEAKQIFVETCYPQMKIQLNIIVKNWPQTHGDELKNYSNDVIEIRNELEKLKLLEE